MIRFIIYLLIAYLAYKAVRLIFAPLPGRKEVKRGRSPELVSDEMVQDPVCGVYIPKKEAKKLRADGRTYYFCSEDCVEEFKQKRRRESDEKHS